MTNSTYITQSSLIAMGWTKSMIAKFMPEPKLVPNPYYKSAAPMRLYDKDKALSVMETEEYAVALEKVNKRKKSAQQAVETKTENLMQQMTNIVENIDVAIIDENKLVKKALKEKRTWYALNGKSDEILDYYYIDGDTLNRWVVNYIRHNLVKYDSTLQKLFGKIGKDKAYHYFKKAVLEKIAEAYPKYKNECFRQIGELDIC